MMRGITGGVVAFFASAALLCACLGRSAEPSASRAEEKDAAADSEADALPPGVAYVVGAYACCEEGRGFSCCAPGEGCGAYRECSPIGGWASGKLICSRCCSGLTLIAKTTVVDGRCVASTTPDDNFCAACGDGACRSAEGEDSCNCPEDCP